MLCSLLFILSFVRVVDLTKRAISSSPMQFDLEWISVD